MAEFLCFIRPQPIITSKRRFQASRATFRHIDLPTNPEQAAAMDSIQEAMEEVVFGNETFSTPIPYSIMYMPWEANEVRMYWVAKWDVAQEMERN